MTEETEAEIPVTAAQISNTLRAVERQFDDSVKRFDGYPSEARLKEYEVKMDLVRDYLGPDGALKTLATALLPATLTDEEVLTVQEGGADPAEFAKDSILGGYEANVTMIAYASKFRRMAGNLIKAVETPGQLAEARERIRVGLLTAEADFKALIEQAAETQTPEDPTPEDPPVEGGV